MAMTRRVCTGDDYCIVFHGANTFRVDKQTVTTPARFYWESVIGEALQDNDILRRGCKTPRCVKHKVRNESNRAAVAEVARIEAELKDLDQKLVAKVMPTVKV